MDKITSKTVEGSRRQFLHGISLLLGTAATAQLFDSSALKLAFAYQTKTDSHTRAGLALNQPQMQMMHDICAIVIPQTNTPGAAEVDAHGWIDHLLKHVFTGDKLSAVKELFAKINLVSKARFAKPFSQINQAQQLTLLSELDTSGGTDFNQADGEAFKFVKGLVIFIYYTGEVGASQEHKYVAVPGGFKGSIPYDSVGCAWGASPFYFFQF